MRCAIVLAAGRSARMGTQKVLLPLGGAPVIALIVDRLGRASIDRILVVIGHDSDRVVEALRGRPVTIVVNPDPGAGMLSSVRCGLRALPPGCEAVLVVLGDQPRISPEVVDAMLRAHEEESAGAAVKKGIVVPIHGGRRGHPILFSARYRDEVLERFDGVGLRGLLAAHPDEVLELEVADASVLSDMDTPEDYRREIAGS